MKLLLDQDVYAATARFLTRLGHDLVQVGQIGLSQANDERLLAIAQEQGRVFVTRDRDFGALVFVKGLRAGVRLPMRKVALAVNRVFVHTSILVIKER